MLGLNTRTVSGRLIVMVTVFVVGMLAFGGTAYYTLNRVKVTGPLYNTIVDSKDLIADVLPPPEYLVESYLYVRMMDGETNQARIQDYVRRLRKLKSEYDDRHKVWVDKLAAGQLRDAMIVRSYDPAMAFWEIVETQLIPAAASGDQKVVHSLAQGPLLRHYEEHRAAIDEVVTMATQKYTQDEATARNEVQSKSLILLTIGLVALGMAIALAVMFGNAITRSLQGAVATITTVTSEFASSIDEQERTAAQQATAVNETSTTMEELGASSRLSSEQADAAASGTRQALGLAENGTSAVEQTLESMSSLKERSGAIAQQILRLSEQTGQIGNITGLVSDLANQTNLLALTAAVEAARAGEHGKGFAVVASEIRKLADQSKKSAERIAALVGEIQQATNSTVMVTEEGSKTVEHGTRLAQSTGAAFNDLAMAIGSTFESVQQIALNARQQAGAVNQVVDAMSSLNSGAREAAAAVTQTKAGVHRLNDAARTLQKLV